ncbi:MAG: phage terminase small subunit P27 family [Porphyromonadaceae bacterium]|nr:phage terminase small subunit P27 family [Porphyromonadaceae bacterium]
MPTIKKKAPKTKPQAGTLRAMRQSIYNTRRWQTLRLRHLKAQPLCAICLEEGRERTAQHVHHKRTFTEAPTRAERCAIAYDPDNLESLCETCHARLHNTRGAAKARAEGATQPPSAPAEPPAKPKGGRGANFGARGAVNPALVTHTQTVFSEVSEGYKKGSARTAKNAPEDPNATPLARYVPPKGLMETTQAEIIQIAAYLEAQDSLEEAHHPALTLLAKTLDRYNRANHIVSREGELVFSASGKPLRHPLLKVANDAQIQALKLLDEFGLTPKSRERIKSLQAGTDEDDPLAQFLKERNK